MWIQLYRLNKALEVLVEVVPICRKRGGNTHIKGVQALAFTIWKQGKYKEAAILFQEIEGLIGPSSALCENMGHTYSSMGDYEAASLYFNRALECHDADVKAGKAAGDRGGVVLGLGLVEDRLGNLEKALESCREAQRIFRVRAAGKPASLIAKAGSSVAKILLKLAKLEPDEAKRVEMEEEAVKIEEENVELFEITCGEDSPLTASALRGLGEALMRRHRYEDAQVKFARSYLFEVQKDAFDLLSVMEVHNSLFSSHLNASQAGGGLNRPAFGTYMPTVDMALERVRQMPQDANAGAYFKVAGEFKAFATDFAGATVLLGKAIELFETEQDKSKVDGLIENCTSLQQFCDSQIASAAKPAQKE